jgi:hypothetical protein
MYNICVRIELCTIAHVASPSLIPQLPSVQPRAVLPLTNVPSIRPVHLDVPDAVRDLTIRNRGDDTDVLDVHRRASFPTSLEYPQIASSPVL